MHVEAPENDINIGQGIYAVLLKMLGNNAWHALLTLRAHFGHLGGTCANSCESFDIGRFPPLYKDAINQ